MAKKEKKQKKEEAEISANNENFSTKGRTFEGFVIKKFPKRIVLEFERTVFVPKYERFYKKKTRLHARLPDSMKDAINVGDYIEIAECRPLSKIIHFIVIKKIRSAESLESKEEKSKK
ncbi:MAG: 30S ribosomal protein S17 [Candidatus Pacearchaeota archaeon]